MKKLLPLLLSALALQLPVTAHSAVVMATVTSSKGTTIIQAQAEKARLQFVAAEVGYAHVNGKLTAIDLLHPAGSGAPSLEVKPGFCAVVGSRENFTSSKYKILGPGSYNVNAQFGFDQGIKALVIYKNSGSSCDPKYDVALVRNSSGSVIYPLPFTFSDTFTNGSTISQLFTANLTWHSSLAASLYQEGRTIHINQNKGGFLPLAQALTVPSCMTAEISTHNGSQFSAGEYSLASSELQAAIKKNGLSGNVRSPETGDCKPINAIQRSAKGALIRHNGNNLCLNPEGGGVPTYDTRAVLTSNCSATDPGNKFRMLFDGTIQHVESGMCLHPRGGSSTPGNGTELVFWPSCGANSGSAGAYIRFENTLKNSLRQLSGRSCLHPNGGSPTPANGTKVVFWQGCNEDRLRFTFDAQ